MHTRLFLYPRASKFLATAFLVVLALPAYAESEQPLEASDGAERPAAAPRRRADGFEMVDLEIGSGAIATVGKMAIVQFVGKLADGRAFTNTYETKRPLRFLVGKSQVVPGFDEAVIGMKVGGRRRAIVPAKLGYGDKGFGTIVPADAPLSFEIELVAVRDRP